MKKFKRIFIEISNVCNLACTFCPPSKRDKKIMNTENFKKALEALQGHGDHVYLHVKGEPLFHPEFEGILDLCKAYNKKINITTNGTLLDVQGPIILKNSAVRLVNISLQSFEDVGDEKAYKAYLNKVLTFVKKGLEDTTILFDLRLWNFEDADLKTTDASKSLIEYIETFLELSEPITISDPSTKSGKLSSRAYISKGYEFEWPSLENKTYHEKGTCFGLRHQIAILSSGDVVPCCLDSEGVMTLGNILKEDFESIVTSDKAKAISVGFENNKIIEPLCKACSYRERFIRQN